MKESIEQQIRTRRRVLGKDAAMAAELGFDDGTWGLAFSGGGIRSATFCFGLLRAFASSRLLLRFDLLSTVSGGGYIGSMLGRLIQHTRDAAGLRVVLDALAGGRSSWLAEWLRANGRYLAPGGFSDRLYAAAVYARNLFAVHIELGVIGLFLGALLSGFDLLAWQGLDGLVHAYPNLEGMTLWREWINRLPSVWALLPVTVALMAVLALAYQAVPMAGRLWLSAGTFGIAAAALRWLLRSDGSLAGAADNIGWDARWTVVGFGITLSIGWLLAVPVAWVVCGFVSRHRVPATIAEPKRTGDVLDAARSVLTSGLSALFKTTAAILLLGLIDRSAWWLSYEHASWQNAGIVLAVVAALARALVPLLAGMAPGGRGNRIALPAANLFGQLLTLALFTWWVAVVHRTVLSEIFTPDGPRLDTPRHMLRTLFAVSSAYMLATGWNLQFLNLFSLHTFYRARLIRSYLGATNPARFPYDAREGLAELRATAPARAPLDDLVGPLPNIWTVDPGDDLPIFQYTPHLQGGPVHLINVCVNQTRSPRTALFNRDRRGRLMTIAPGGLVRIGQRAWQALSHDGRALTLGSWTAISGAAVGSALGSRTRTGISALAMFAGARLGYWWDSAALADTPPRRLAERIWRNLFAKSRGLMAEVQGRFRIIDGRHWYLTDGGHFENTGAYALLAERCRFIVLADCGADPKYAFDDLENLVRKARIDLQCEVRFQRPRRDLQASDPGKALTADYGSLNELASNSSQCCLALARVDYRDPPAQGYLVLVKPNLCRGLPVDLLNFKDEQPEFPQQSTADQFFDEAQWESYFHLGQVLGDKLSRPRVDAILEAAGAWFVDDDGLDAGARGETPGRTPVPASRLPARIASTTAAVTASVGLGAFATAGVAAWQAIDTWRTSQAQAIKDDDAAMKELADLWAALPAPAGSASAARNAGALAATLARVSARMCATGDAPSWFDRSPLAVDVLASARLACAQLAPADTPPSCRWLEAATYPTASWPHASCLRDETARIEHSRGAPDCYDYWAYDYRKQAVRPCSQPGFAAAREAQQLEHERQAMYTVEGSAFPVQGKGSACEHYTIRPVIYGRSQAATARVLAGRWNAQGATVAGTEDLILKAAIERRPLPMLAEVSSIRYAAGAADACLGALQSAATKPAGHFVPVPFIALPTAPDAQHRRWTIDVVITAPTIDQAAEAHRRAIDEVTVHPPSDPTLKLVAPEPAASAGRSAAPPAR